MDYCDLVKRIEADPKKLMADQLGREMTVRDVLGLKAHLATCTECQVRVDDVNDQNPEPPGFYKGDVN